MSLSPKAARGSSLVISCGACGEEFMVTCDISVGKVLYVAQDLPPELAAIGYSAGDPWVKFEVRMTKSQRDVIHRAIREAQSEIGVSDGRSLSSSRALELICGDFLAGSGVSGGG
jgi:hypothetical protein